MSQRDEYPHGVPCWVDTIQPDPEAAAAFYARLFGWEVSEPHNLYRVARLRGRDVGGIAPMPPMVAPAPSPGWVTHVRVDGIEATAERARAAGGSVLFGPYDAEPAGRLGVLQDPAGAVFSVWEPGSRRGAQLVNEPGAWAMSSLATPDPAAAAAFYGALFGWSTEEFAMGEDVVTMFRLPGYVGGEPEQPVSREVVATMTPAADGEPARWHVDFWVQDVDAAAAVAATDGGRVVVAPFDLPIGRSAVLADPAGAPFSVSRMGPRADAGRS